ncbi:MAG: insulinase family protein [Bacteroidales bacterium]|nr:insulinase family protein [Bacteroidales bacterium]
MIPFQRFVLKNGLRVIVHEDASTPLASCNVVYNVGSKDENPEMTGMAHLFEHFMFCGSKNIPNYDEPLQKVGGINNAYTSQDLTHYYSVVPAENIETSLWLESDRMLELAFDEEQLRIQKNVVSEEFKENFLNAPFGDVWMIFNDLLYDKMSYKWLPIGKNLNHIAAVEMPMMKDFFYRFYRPNNAVLVLAGNVHAEEMLPLVEKWFGDIPSSAPKNKSYLLDDEQLSEKRKRVERNVPYDLLVKGWKCGGRLERDFYVLDLISDLFGSGHSSYLYQKFITEEKLFVDLTAYVSGTLESNAFIVVGRPADGVSLEKADEILSSYLYDFQYDESIEKDLMKVQNKVESALLSNEIRIDDRATSLALAETFSRVEDFQEEQSIYRSVCAEEVKRITHQLFVQKSATTLLYKSKS